MPDRTQELGINKKLMDMNTARIGSTTLDVVAGFTGGLAANALIIERRPIKAALLSVATIGAGILACRGGLVHEDHARELGRLQSERAAAQ